MFDQLESRRLMTASLDINSGVLTVVDTVGNDEITIRLTANNIVVGDIPDSGYSEAFLAANVTSLVVNCTDGADSVVIDPLIFLNATINMGGGDDTVISGSGNDTIHGGTGSDDIDGGDGSDIMYGDNGTDMLNYSRRTRGVDVTLDGLPNDGEKRSYQENDNADITFEVVQGTSGSDTIAGSNSNSPVTIYGNDGADTLLGSRGNDRLHGGRGNDFINGLNGNDTLITGGGSDIVRGGRGVDTSDWYFARGNVKASLDGKANDGIDTTTSPNGNDEVNAEHANLGLDIEYLVGSNYNDRLSGNDAPNNIQGGTGDDTITGGAGNDTLSGGNGKDSISGEAGNDLLDGGLGNDTFTGGGGFDTVSYLERSENLTIYMDGSFSSGALATGELDIFAKDIRGLISGTGADTIYGTAFADNIDGGNGNDSILSGSGNDTLQAGSGFDNVFAGPGADTIATSDNLTDTVSGGSGVDTLFGDNFDVVTSVP